MSVKCIAKVWDGYPGGGSELLALLALADWSDDDGRCWPSIASVAKKTRLERRQAQRVIHSLIDDGYVVVTGNETGGAPGSTRQYRIALSKLTGVSHDTPTGVAKDTGVFRDTGVTGDADGCHPRRETGVSHDTQTVIDTSVHVNNNTRAQKSARFDAADYLVSHGVDSQVVADWMALRKAKRAAVTQTAIAGIEREAEKAGLTLAAALAICCERGWQGFNADWMVKHQPAANGGHKPAPENFDARDYGNGGRL